MRVYILCEKGDSGRIRKNATKKVLFSNWLM